MFLLEEIGLKEESHEKWITDMFLSFKNKDEQKTHMLKALSVLDI